MQFVANAIKLVQKKTQYNFYLVYKYSNVSFASLVWYGIVGFNVPILGHFGDDFTGHMKD